MADFLDSVQHHALCIAGSSGLPGWCCSACTVAQLQPSVPPVEEVSAIDLRRSYEIVLTALQELAREAGKTASRDVSSGHDQALEHARRLLREAGRIR